MEQFKTYLIQEEKSPLTVEKYIRDVRGFLRWLDGRELSKAEVLSYKEKLTESYAITSVNSILSSVNSYLDYLGRGDCRSLFKSTTT